jgi:NAD(P)H-flavin reductase
MVGLPGFGEAPISFSSLPPEDGRSFSHAIRAVGRVTRALDRLEAGDEVFFRGPYGRGWPMEEARGRDVLVVAGGIGLVPLRPYLLKLFEDRSRYGEIVLLYGARRPEDLMYREELASWRTEHELTVHLAVDEAPEGEAWEGKVGVVTELFDELDILPYRALTLVCGPEIMMRFVVRGLRRMGYPPSRIYLSLERRMKCGFGHCGHCQIGEKFVCKDGPVFSYREIRHLPDTLL